MDSLSRIIRRWGGTKRRAGTRAPGCSARPALECLEDRAVPSTLVTEIPLPPAANGGITLGPDLNLWFTGTGMIGRRTPSGSLTQFNLPNGASSNPTGVTAGPDGNLWFVDLPQNSIGRVTTTGVVTEFPIPNCALEGPLVAAPDGNLWFTMTLQVMYPINRFEYSIVDYRGNFGRITPQGAITSFGGLNLTPASNALSDLSVGAGSLAHGNPLDNYYQIGSAISDLTVGPDGNLWAASGAGITKTVLPTATNPNPSFTLFTQGITSSPDWITAGPDGNLWFSETSTSTVGTITPTGVVTQLTLPTSYAISSIVAGPDGKLWFTEQSPASSPTTIKVGRMSTAGTLEAEFTAPSTFYSLAGPLVVGPQGTLWFGLNNGGMGIVQGVLDPNALTVEKLYEAALGRLAGPADFAYWTPQVDAGNSAAVADGIERSPEARRHVVSGWYQTYLGRAADPAGLDYFSGLMLVGARQDQALANLLASDEYYNHAGAIVGAAPSDTTLVQALYQQLLGRAAGALDLAFWLGQLPALGREGLAYGILTSQEYRTILVNGYFSSLLRWQGPVDPNAVLYFVLQPWGPTTLRVQLELTPAFILNG